MSAAQSTVLYLLATSICVHASGQLPWSWDTVPLWADFFSRSSPLFSEYQYEFMANTYDIISLEKCLGTTGNTETAFYEAATGIRRYSQDTKILFYWNVDTCYCDCYDITQTVLQNSSMWLYDDNGNELYAGTTTRPHYDLTQPFVRNWWTQSLVTIFQGALARNLTINGIFADGLCSWFGSSISTERRNEYVESIRILLNDTKKAFEQLDMDFFILGNGLIGYSFQPDYCLSAVPYVDGLCIEHYGAFEQVNTNTGTLNADYLLTWYNVTNAVMDGEYGEDKSIFIKAWPGPVTGPIDGMGPSWPTAFGQRPATYQGMANASAELITFPLAVYLCGIYRENTYFSYAWWYGWYHGYIPCPDDLSSCAAPTDWYEEFTQIFGEPLADRIMTDTYKCNRSFEYANVYVDLTDNTSAIIEWFTWAPTTEPTESPTIESTAALTSNTISVTSTTMESRDNSNGSSEKKGVGKVAIAFIVVGVIVVCIVVAVVVYRRMKSKQMQEEPTGVYEEL